jgi:uncharacterized membrane protein YgdD (TMEM256/DUF423 family)
MNGISVGAFLAALGIALGAFGAHGLKSIGPERLGFWTTATHYHLIAALGLIAIGLAGPRRRGLRIAAAGLLAGITLFCGSLYAMALGAPRWLGAITPLGGISLIVGFVGFGLAAFQRRN